MFIKQEFGVMAKGIMLFCIPLLLISAVLVPPLADLMRPWDEAVDRLSKERPESIVICVSYGVTGKSKGSGSGAVKRSYIFVPDFFASPRIVSVSKADVELVLEESLALGGMYILVWCLCLVLSFSCWIRLWKLFKEKS